MTVEQEMMINDIRNTLSDAAKFEQMAEECIELAHACMKKARKIRNENYTPRKSFMLDDDISEELTDVMICVDTLELHADDIIKAEKINRWHRRVCGVDAHNKILGVGANENS